MSSIKDSGENEFAYEESNIVGISENNPDEMDKKILKSIKKRNDLRRRDKKDNILHFFNRELTYGPIYGCTALQHLLVLQRLH